MKSRRGRLVVLEGIDGSGKSTLQRTLATRLRREGVAVRLWAEPSNTALGRAARRSGRGDPFTSAMLFTLDRAAQRPRLDGWLASGITVVMDRSFFSTLAYQGPAVSPSARPDIEKLQRQVARVPDLVLWLDLPPAEALRRVAGRGRPRESFERLRTLARTSAAYRRLSKVKGNRFVRLDGRLPRSELADAAMAAIHRRSPA